jgi:acyl-CoA thioester hydrolase
MSTGLPPDLRCRPQLTRLRQHVRTRQGIGWLGRTVNREMTTPQKNAASRNRQDRAGVTTKMRVRYADTDAQGVVYHGAFFTLFEVARFDLLGALLGSVDNATRLWRRLVIASAHCEYHAPVGYPEVVTITASVSRIGTASFEIAYELSTHRGNVVADGVTVQVHVDARGRPRPLSAVVRRRFAQRPRRRTADICSAASSYPSRADAAENHSQRSAIAARGGRVAAHHGGVSPRSENV